MPRSTRTRVVLAAFVVLIAALPTFAQRRDRTQALTEISGLREQLRQKEREFLEPAAEDRAAYVDFLAQPDTGIVRLLPREKFDDHGPASPSPLTTSGGGAYYSFTRLTHEYGYGSDIQLENDEFQVGFAGCDYGWLVAIGDVPIESATVDHPAISYLDSLVTPTVEPEVRATQRKTGQGVKHGEYAYWSRVPATVGTTYALRSISYDEYDILVALRVVRKDDDGSVVLLWKRLKTYPAPKLVRERTPAVVE